MRPKTLRGVSVTVAAAVVGGALALTLPQTGATPPTRIMVVGDSVTQGSVGDWTWRYRLWQHLRSVDADVDFVGPNAGVCCDEADRQDETAYADPDFDRDHAARWGMTLERQDYPVSDLVRTYHPDVVVEYLGINDLIWRGTPPEGVLDMVTDFVTDVQSADPDTDVVLGSLPQTWKAGVDEFDAGLPALAEALSTETSLVRVARPEEPFVQDVDTWDPAHPSATGEVKLAAGVADALAEIGIGAPYERPLPVVANGPTTPPALIRALPGNEEARLTWELPPGATAVYVWLRDATVGEVWRRLPYPVAGSSWVSGGLENFHDWEYRLQATKGTAVAENLFSNVVSVRPAPGTMGIVTTTPGDRAVDLLWPVVPDATAYDVVWQPADGSGEPATQTVTATSTTLSGLVAGGSYTVAVTPRWGEESGWPRTVTATAGGPVPARVSGMEVVLDRRDRARLVWPRVSGVTRYEVQQRSGSAWTTAGSVARTRFRTDGLPPGRHAFRVRAWFEQLAGPWSPVARARVR